MTVEWDFDGRMVAATTPTEALTFSYDVDGIRWQKTVGGVATHFVVDKNRDFAQVLEERDAAGAIDVLYVYGDDLISQERAATGLHFYHVDGQMSTRQLTDGSANVTDTYTFDAFGVTLAQAGATPNNYLYAGEQIDLNMGFYYLRARYLNHGAGRFVSQDPLQGIPTDPSSLHKYLYGNADAVNRRDPAGLFTLVEILVAIGIILLVAGVVVGIVALAREARIAGERIAALNVLTKSRPLTGQENELVGEAISELALSNQQLQGIRGGILILYTDVALGEGARTYTADDLDALGITEFTSDLDYSLPRSLARKAAAILGFDDRAGSGLTWVSVGSAGRRIGLPVVSLRVGARVLGLAA